MCVHLRTHRIHAPIPAARLDNIHVVIMHDETKMYAVVYWCVHLRVPISLGVTVFRVCARGRAFLACVRPCVRTSVDGLSLIFARATSAFYANYSGATIFFRKYSPRAVIDDSQTSRKRTLLAQNNLRAAIVWPFFRKTTIESNRQSL